MLTGTAATKTRAHQLRRAMSLPEVLLWQALKGRRDGPKFRRQHPSGPFVADFYCHEARLIVEIDGETHNRGDRAQRDASRDRWFSTRQFQVLRIAAAEVLADPAAVADRLVTAASPLHRPPHGGDRKD